MQNINNNWNMASIRKYVRVKKQKVTPAISDASLERFNTYNHLNIINICKLKKHWSGSVM